MPALEAPCAASRRSSNILAMQWTWDQRGWRSMSMNGNPGAGPPPPRDRGSADPPGAHKFRNFGSARTGLNGRYAGRESRRSTPPLPRQGGGLGDPPPDFTAPGCPGRAIRIGRRPPILGGSGRAIRARWRPLICSYPPLSGPEGSLSACSAARKALLAHRSGGGRGGSFATAFRADDRGSSTVRARANYEIPGSHQFSPTTRTAILLPNPFHANGMHPKLADHIRAIAPQVGCARSSNGSFAPA